MRRHALPRCRRTDGCSRSSSAMSTNGRRRSFFARLAEGYTGPAMTTFRRFAAVFTAAVALAAALLSAQQGTLTPAEQQRRKDLEARLQEIAVVERRVMIPMKDGVRLATDIYRPK